MKQEIILKSGWIKVDKEELDKLRQKIREKYESEGGTKKFNAHLPNYEELREIIINKLKEIEEQQDIVIKIQDLPEYDIVPGNTFFRNLLYTNKDAKGLQFQEYNIDICYLFTFGKKRFEQKRFEKKLLEDFTIYRPTQKHGLNVIISSTLNNMSEAEKVSECLKDKFDIKVETEIRNSQTFSKGSLFELYGNLDSNEQVFIIISRDFLQNENCLRELIDLEKSHPDLYLSHTFHILLKDIYEGDFNIFDSLGRSELLKYWKLRIEKLEKNHKLLVSDRKEKEFYKKLRTEFDEIKKIIEELHDLLDFIRENQHKVYYEILLNKINSYDELTSLLPKLTKPHIISSSLELTYKRIKIPSTNNPAKPEFPPEPFYTPKFPASETRKLSIPGFSNVWLKDESTNPTGTHKDRMAWEVVIKYKSLIESLKYKNQDSLPQMSIISSGSAAIAIQHLFNLFKIPTRLKVLVDKNLNNGIKESIKQIGCELYITDLSERLLTSDDIKEITDNKNGIDITYREVLDPTHDNYYDWMSYEILREKPDYCFIPFGTGDLFINVLNIVKIEYFNSFVAKHDPRFFSDINSLKKCSFLGASTNLPNSRLDKLFSSFLPNLDSFKKYIVEMKEEYDCVGQMTGIYNVDESNVDRAIEIANSQKIKFEPSGMAGLALLLQMKDSIPKSSKILLVNTGKTKSVEELII
ncbi:MAG: PLP-dependent lyase/thiolase [Bacteroidetes bacterium]|nr:MAG: PLP-dependent lyase/thiolase [Bacteroidota bacterium]